MPPKNRCEILYHEISTLNHVRFCTLFRVEILTRLRFGPHYFAVFVCPFKSVTSHVDHSPTSINSGLLYSLLRENPI